MKYAKMRLTLLLTVLTSLTGCSGLNSECSDGIDNDRLSLTDTYDPACNVSRELPARCLDEGNGLLVEDPACSQSTKGGYEAADPLCANRKDDDGDGLIDALDPGCQNHLGEYNPYRNNETNPQCSDGIDNDEEMGSPTIYETRGAEALRRAPRKI